MNVRNSFPAPFIQFAHTAEEIGATTKRLEKAAILQKYFGMLSDDNLILAARYFGGMLFPLRDGRVVSVGGAALLSSVVGVTGADETHFRQRLVALGDVGDATFEAWNNSSLSLCEPALSLHALNTFFENLAATAGSLAKRKLIGELLQQCAPLEAKYVVKLLAGDLRIGLKEGAVEDAIARASETPVARVQWTNMLTGDIGETALLARHHQLDTAQMRLFHPLKFMLASPAADLSDVAKQMPEEFAVEDKFDGIRAQVHIAPHAEGDDILHGTPIENRRVAIFSRTLDEITRSFPDLVAPLAALLPDDLNSKSDGLILDGEIVPIELASGRILSFQELQKRLGRKVVSAEVLEAIPVAFVAYDALYGDGRVLITDAFSTRRKVLCALHFDLARTRLATSQIFNDVGLLDAEFEAARARGNEGLMVKDLASTYKPGRRGKEWLKIKRAVATLDVVVTSVEVGNGRRHKVLSDYTFAVRASETDPTLLNVGKAYSGLTDKEIEALSEWFRAHTIQEFAHGKVRIVEPQIVLEITFDRVQISARHKSGFALRFPRILRVRDDKPVEEIDTLETVRKLAE